MYRDEISNLYRGPAIDASYQVSVHSLVSNVPKYIKDHLKENCVKVNFDILSKKDAYLERIVHSKNVRFVYKGLCECNHFFTNRKIFQMGKTS